MALLATSRSGKRCRRTSSVFKVALKLSAIALCPEETDATIGSMLGRLPTKLNSARRRSFTKRFDAGSRYGSNLRPPTAGTLACPTTPRGTQRRFSRAEVLGRGSLGPALLRLDLNHDRALRITYGFPFGIGHMLLHPLYGRGRVLLDY